MWLIVLLYLLMASTFTLAKTAVFYMQPIFFIGLRMSIAGMAILAFLWFFKRQKWYCSWADRWLLLQMMVFHIYCAYVFEFWGLQYMSSSKACLLYNLSPFITALLGFVLFGHILSIQKWFGLLIGFGGMLPILWIHTGSELSLCTFGFLASDELALLFSVTCSAYGWILMKRLIVERGYTAFMVNGIGMMGGGLAALATALLIEGPQPFIWHTQESAITTMSMALICMVLLIIIANIIGYNLYGYLLKRYSATFLSFAGFMTPFFAGIFGWFFLGESLSNAFFISLILTMAGLYLFYHYEMTQ